jgi:N-acetylmuramic acid 6-phosphate (MurNAc-6-P) etherase
MELLDIGYDEADRLLLAADGSVKLAITMSRLGIDRDKAQQKLAAVDGFLWKLLDS